jgi:hypothetical protein
MALSAFGDRSCPPQAATLAATLGEAVVAWNELQRRLAARFSPLEREWGFTSQTTGWGLRLKHAKRVVLYMTPRPGSFLVSFALGERAVQAARASGLPTAVLECIEAAPKYAEGRGVRIEVRGVKEVEPLEKLAALKMAT